MKQVFLTHAFVVIRNFIFPFKRIEKYYPQKAKILDVGCGHGTLAIMLAKSSKSRTILGIDPSDKKIKAAKKLGKGLNNLRFKRAYLEETKEKNFDIISIIDVLYLLPDKQKLETLKLAKTRLKKNGKLILKDTEAGLLLKLEEILMTKVLKLTYSDHSQTHFIKQNRYKTLLKKAGFKIISSSRPKTLLPYSHFLFVAKPS